MKLSEQMFTEMHRLLPKEISGLDLSEPKADCNHCSMSKPKYRGKYPYNPHLKCCTYHPLFPNYVIGAILENPEMTELHDWIRGKIKNRQYALPIGILAPPNYQVAFNNRKAEDFGNREDFLCPFYDRGTELCKGWKYRGSVCTTHFCKNSYGAKGKDIRKQLADYLWYAESSLMEETLALLDFSPRETLALLDFHNLQEYTEEWMKGDSIPEKEFKKLWNGYTDLEEFYKKSFAIVKNYKRTEFMDLLGETGQALEDDLLSSIYQ